MIPKISKIEAQKRKGRYNIYLDEKYEFPVSEDVLIKYQLFKGMEIDETLKTELINADTVSKLYARALNYLAHQLRTVAEVREKLSELTDDVNRIDEVVAKLGEQRLLNDQNYADSYVRTIVDEGQKGPGAIRRHLQNKKVANSMIEQAINQYFSTNDQVANGTKVAKQQLKRMKRESTRRSLDKTRQFLYQRGFDSEVIEIIMQAVAPVAIEKNDEAIIMPVAEKYWRKYRAQEPYQRRQKTKQALYRKGFQIDDIETALNQLAVES